MTTELGFALPSWRSAGRWPTQRSALPSWFPHDRDHVDEALVASAIKLDDEVMQRIDDLMLGGRARSRSIARRDVRGAIRTFDEIPFPNRPRASESTQDEIGMPDSPSE